MTDEVIVNIAGDFELPDALRADIRNRFGENILVRRTSSPQEYSRVSIEERMSSLEKAFRYLLEAYPTTRMKKDRLEPFLAGCRAEHSVPPVALASRYQDILVRYTGALTEKVQELWGLHNAKEAAAWLDTAEQYMLSAEDKPCLVTVKRIEAHDSPYYIVMSERPIPPCSPDMEKEMDAVRNGPDPRLPFWVDKIAEIGPEFLRFVQQASPEEYTSLALIQAFAEFKGQFEKRSGYTQDCYKALSDALIQTVPPSRIPAKIRAFDEALTRLCNRLQPDVARELAQLRSKPLGVDVYPEGFKRLPRHEQALFWHTMQNGGIRAAVARLRSIRVLANSGWHESALHDVEGTCIARTEPSIRFSHLVPRGLVKAKWPQELLRDYTRSNLEYVASLSGDAPLLLQTLISPLPTAGVTPDRPLDNELQQSVMEWARAHPEKEIVFINHALNIARLGLYTPKVHLPAEHLKDLVRSQLSPGAIKARLVAAGGTGEALEGTATLVMAEAEFVRQNTATAGALPLLREICSKLPSGVLPSGQHPGDLVSRALAEAFRRQSGVQSSSPRAGTSAGENYQDSLSDLVSAYFPQLKWLSGWEPVMTAWLARKQCHDQVQVLQLSKVADVMSDSAWLLAEYERTLNSPPGTATWRDNVGRELFLASLERLMSPGVTAGSCVSGKDRLGIVHLHVDAMWSFRRIYGYWPSSSDTGARRAQFVDHFAQMYLAWHPQLQSGFGAPGCTWLKTPDWYLPKDIADAIRGLCNHQGILDIEDMFASNNDIPHIKGRNCADVIDYAHCQEAARRYSPEQCQSLFTELKPLLGEKKFWVSQTAFSGTLGLVSSKFISPPSGIGMLHESFSRFSGPENCQTLLAEHFRIVMERFGKKYDDPNRSEKTRMLYEAYLVLFEGEDPAASMTKALTIIRNLRNGVYNQKGRASPPPTQITDAQIADTTYQGSGASSSSSSSSSMGGWF